MPYLQGLKAQTKDTQPHGNMSNRQQPRNGSLMHVSGTILFHLSGRGRGWIEVLGSHAGDFSCRTPRDELGLDGKMLRPPARMQKFLNITTSDFALHQPLLLQ